MAELPLHPRLARMVIGAVEAGDGGTGCALAALLEERDVLRGRRDELPADLSERLRAFDGRSTTGSVDTAALQLVRRRAAELARRVQRSGHPIDPRNVDPHRGGPLLALAYVDRVAKALGDGRFRLRHGAGASLPIGDTLSGEPFLVIADIQTGGAGSDRGPDRRSEPRIRLAAAIDEADVEAAAHDAIEQVTTLAWDRRRDDLRVRTERRLGVLVLAGTDGPATPGDATRAALLDKVRDTDLDVLSWTRAARSLQARVGFAGRGLDTNWPDLSDAALLGSLEDWLEPRLMDASRRSDLEKVDVLRALRDRIGHHRLVELDRLVPVRLTLPGGRSVPIDYDGDAPSIAVRVQELFGTTEHPTVAGGRVPIVVHLLSPAGRPIQTTADLPGFWAGSWSAVRKEMAGRYPKHRWPTDPR